MRNYDIYCLKQGSLWAADIMNKSSSIYTTKFVLSCIFSHGDLKEQYFVLEDPSILERPESADLSSIRQESIWKTETFRDISPRLTPSLLANKENKDTGKPSRLLTFT